jgi:hypothetical protein
MSMINWYWKQEVNTNGYQGNDPHNINHSCHKPQNTVDTNGYQGNDPQKMNRSCHKPQNTVDTNGYHSNDPHINHSCHKT